LPRSVALRRALKLAAWRGGLSFGAAWLDVTAQDDACRRIYQVGLFARSADNGLISVDVYIVCGKALDAKARVQAAVDEWRHSIIDFKRPRRLAMI
jgi:hypothetical protein